MLELDTSCAGRDLSCAVDALERQLEVGGAKFGCIGFCMGGKLALYGASLVPEIAAVVDCYGVHPNISVDFSSWGARVLGIFAENDEFVSGADVKALSESLDAAGVESRMLTYVGVQHAFLNESRPDVFDADNAAEAWRDIDSFLEAELH